MTGLTHFSLFSGIGGFDLAAEWAGFRTVCFVEKDKYCQKVLKKHWPGVPLVEDIRDVTEEAITNAISNREVGDKPQDGQRRGSEQESKDGRAERYCPLCKEWYPESSWQWEEGGKCPDCGEVVANAKSWQPGKSQTRNWGQDTGGGSKEKPLARNTKSDRGKEVAGFSEGENSIARGVCGADRRPRGITAIPPVTLVTGGFPCQSFSHAGKRKGKADDRYLWPEMFRVIKIIKPTWVLAENVPGIIKLALNDVLSDLEGEGYSTETLIIPACAVNAPHRRDRIWIVGYAEHDGWANLRIGELQGKPDRQKGTLKQPSGASDVLHPTGRRCKECPPFRQEKKDAGETGGQDAADTKGKRLEGADTERNTRPEGCPDEYGQGGRDSDWWAVEPNIRRVAHGIPHRVDRLKCLGNAIVPQVAYQILKVIAEIENGSLLH